jgi:uncharacterized protein YcbK (DUF882 family)
MGDLSKDFSRKEFECKDHCGAFAKSQELITGLQKVRDRLGKPIIVTSGTRCNAHNREVGGADTSAHLSGLAADITCEDMYSLAKYCFQVFKRVGVAPGYVHVDVDKSKPQGIYWVYGANGKRISV